MSLCVCLYVLKKAAEQLSYSKILIFTKQTQIKLGRVDEKREGGE